MVKTLIKFMSKNNLIWVVILWPYNVCQTFKNCFRNINTNLLWFYMHSSFEARLRAFNVKLQLHMLQPMLDVLHMPKVEIYTEHMHKTTQTNNNTTLLLDWYWTGRKTQKFPPHMLPSSSTGGHPVTLDRLPKCTNHLDFQSNRYFIVLFTWADFKICSK